MRRNLSRLTGCLLSAALVFTSLPVSAYAAETVDDIAVYEETDIIAADSETLSEETLGESVSDTVAYEDESSDYVVPDET
ncbi:MAG: hypothetical protein K5857_10080 [Lachnospiraceae bacterium]|nr:hypothetical protein [Lachnospiraceae bacterium]